MVRKRSDSAAEWRLLLFWIRTIFDFGYVLDTFGYILDTFWIRGDHFGYVLDTLKFGYVFVAFWIRFGYVLDTVLVVWDDMGYAHSLNRFLMHIT